MLDYVPYNTDKKEYRQNDHDEQNDKAKRKAISYTVKRLTLR